MKNILIFFFLLPIIGFAQTPTLTENFVRTKVYKTPTTTSISTPTPAQALQNVSYLNGFGKPIQEVTSQYSGTGKNIVQPIEYDAMGRLLKKYLSYSTQTNGLDYESSALMDVQNYTPYQGQNPYNEMLYEDSSLDRLKKVASPGADWAMGNGHEKDLVYDTNDDISGPYPVKLFVATATWNSGLEIYDVTLSQTTNYSGGTLYKKIERNENWTSGSLNNAIENFIDRNGRLILKRIYDGTGTIDTYYVYDQFGNLSFIIPPKADAAITQNVLNRLCYQYKYDSYNRLVEKKMPGKEWEYIVYDKLNRVVATGPTAPPFTGLTAGGWLITKYDAYNRPVLTGWMSGGSSNWTSNYRKTTQTQRNSETVFNESRTSSTPDVTISGVTFRYTNLTLPRTAYHTLTVNYYDDYTYLNAPSVPTTITPTGDTVYYNNTLKPKGLLTGQWVRAITTTASTSKNEQSYIFYDSKSRPIRIYTKNHELNTVGFTQFDIKYTPSGQKDYTITTHKRVGGDPPLTIKDSYTYSDQDRMLAHTSQINGGTIQLIASNTYDELGKLISKEVGNTTTSPLQKIDYTYNIKGRLTNINDIGNLVQSGAPVDLFALKINYNTVQNDLNAPAISKQYSGNISEIYWRTNNDNVIRKYAYKYDDLNRLKYAFYRLPGTATPSIKSYDEGMTYDKNGNIITLHRNGDVDATNPPNTIDELTYTYETDSNRLMKVDDDPVTATSGFKDGTNTGDDYTYDDYGNIISDANKGITNILYNHLNQPIKITFGTTGTIEYIYNANGVKLEKKVTVGTASPITTKYFKGFQYVNDVLQFFPTDEGYVSKVGSTFRYVFQYKDHLGNVRINYTMNTTTGNAEIIEENNFYPYGLKHSGYNSTILSTGSTEAQKYKFIGTEFQNELGLNTYDFGARNYDPSLGRWMNMDPMAEKFHMATPYNYALNNPAYYIDIDGYEPTPYEAALMAQHVYNNSGSLVGGWERSSINDFTIYDVHSGLKAALYQREIGGVIEYAFVYAGTDGLDGTDWLNNLSQALGMSDQYDNVTSLSSKVSNALRNKELTFVGHSLGGGLSNLSALVTGRSSITFNPAWLSVFTLMNIDPAPAVEDRHITNYVNQFDPLNAIQELLGNDFGLYESGETVILDEEIWDGNWDGHFIGESIDSLEDNNMDYHYEPEPFYQDRFNDTDLMRDNGIVPSED